MTKIVKISCLSKLYKSKHSSCKALYNVDLEISEGEVFCLVGHNGAGKTTLIKTILGLTDPSEGYIEVFKSPPGALDALNLIGYLPEDCNLPEFMTVRELLHFYGCLFPMKKAELKSKIDDVIHKSGLDNKQNERVEKLSKGSKQRLLLAQALINSPEMLILDEPTNGLDPMGIRDLLALLEDFKNRGKTVLFCSHQLTEVEKIAERVGFLREGKLIEVKPMQEILKQKSLEDYYFNIMQN